jgi:hypothetical protein
MIVCGRFPGGLSCQASFDAGMTRKLWVDLSGGWAGGTFFETAPDELVHIYGGRGQEGGGGPPWTARKFRMRVDSANQKLIPIDW